MQTFFKKKSKVTVSKLKQELRVTNKHQLVQHTSAIPLFWFFLFFFACFFKVRFKLHC